MGNKKPKSETKATRQAMLIVIVLMFAGCRPQHDQYGNAAVPQISTQAHRDSMILQELQKQTLLLKEIRDHQK